MFVDQAKISVKAGRGGNGCQSFYSDMYTPRGIPDGGDGGRGADIVMKADRNLRTLLDFRYNRHFSGKHGGHGSSKQQKGRDAETVVIRVPVGTEVIDTGRDCVLSKFELDGQQVVIAKGGKGGMGNRKNRPVTQGEPGEERELLLDLKLIADVGVVGFPNAGKSTLISAVTNARPEIAAYPFTTKAPVLGVVPGDDPFVIADIPGLIEGSSQGRGLGDRFLRHVERTKVLVHLVDMSGCEGRDPLEDYRVILKELKDYPGAGLSRKPQVVAANKMDLPQSKENLKRFKRYVKKPVYPVSAKEHDGLEKLINALRKAMAVHGK